MFTKQVVQSMLKPLGLQVTDYDMNALRRFDCFVKEREDGVQFFFKPLLNEALTFGVFESEPYEDINDSLKQYSITLPQ